MTTIFKLLLCMVCLSLLASGEDHAATIFVGQDVKKCRELMKGYGDGSLLLDFELKKPGSGLNTWHVGKGVIMVWYKKKDDVVTGISFYISDDKPKADSFTLFFNVIEFNPGTKQLTVSLAE